MERTEIVATATGEAYRGTFASDAPPPEPGTALPPGWEGLLFAFDVALADLRPDGSPARDGVLPEIDLPRRLYAGEDTVFHRPLHYGETVTQSVRAGDLVDKTGRSGRLVFADLVRELRVDGRLAVESVWHDVFLGAADPGAPAPAPVPAPTDDPTWREQHRLDARALFRFSAITFNTHRVHYDRAWAQGEEGLDDLLVHGPLTRILLLDAALRHHDGEPSRYAFRAIAPSFVDRPFTIEGRDSDAGTEVLAVDAAGAVLARGLITWR